MDNNDLNKPLSHSSFQDVKESEYEEVELVTERDENYVPVKPTFDINGNMKISIKDAFYNLINMPDDSDKQTTPKITRPKKYVVKKYRRIKESADRQNKNITSDIKSADLGF